MDQEKLVTVALGTYNGAKYIQKQLDSILNQTYKNIEIVIVDDCSTDNTFDIVKSYAEKDSRIRYYQNEANLGFNKNFEKAVRLGSGAYISISDQDDIWLPEKIETLVGHIGTNWVISSNSFRMPGDVMTGDKIINGGLTINSYKNILLSNFVTGHSILFKRKFLDYILPFPEEGFYDWWIGFIALYHQKIVFLDVALTHYRIHQESVMQQRWQLGIEEQEHIKTIDHMLAVFLSYKNLEDRGKAFIKGLRKAYKLNLNGETKLPLIRIIVENYKWLFPNYKKRNSLSLLNFAIKYTRKSRIGVSKSAIS